MRQEGDAALTTEDIRQGMAEKVERGGGEEQGDQDPGMEEGPREKGTGADILKRKVENMKSARIAAIHLG